MATLPSRPYSTGASLPLGVLVVAISMLVHLVLLGVARWPIHKQGMPVVAVSLELVAPPPLPVPPIRPSEPAVTLQQDSYAFAGEAPEPTVLMPMKLPLPDTGLGRVLEGRASIAAVVASADTPPVELAGVQVPARRIVFLVDVSASMGGAMGDDATLGSVAADAVCMALKGLPDAVQFRLMLLSSGLSEPMGSQWNWVALGDRACEVLRAAVRSPGGLTRSGAMFDDGGIHETGAQAVVLVTDGGILDLEAGTLQRWLEASPGVRFDVVLIGPVGTPDQAQRWLTVMAQRTGGDVHRLFGSVP